MMATQRSTRAAGMVTALIFVLCLSLLLGGSMVLVSQHYRNGWYNSRTESALLLAEAGINDEIQYIATHFGDSSVTTKSSPPTAGVGETEVYPGEGHTIYGRKGSVDGFSGKYFWVHTSTDSAGTTAWDGITPSFYITARAKVDGAWRKVQVKCDGLSTFGLYAIVALASYTNNSNAIVLSSATATVTGTMLTNGQVSNSSSTIVASNAINANTIANPNGQFTSGNVVSGGTLSSMTGPWIYPSTVEALKLVKGQSGLTDAQAWTWIANSANNQNATGIYTYRPSATGSTVNSTNCQAASLSFGGSPTLNNATWNSAGYKPGTTNSSNNVAIDTTAGSISNTTPIEITTSANHGLTTGQSVQITGASIGAVNGTWVITRTGPKKFTLNSSTASGSGQSGTVSPNLVRTLIFEPGDYFFNQVNISWDNTVEWIVDSSGILGGDGSGQVRIWIYDPSNGTQNDTISVQILAANGATPNPDGFRLYYGKDNKTITISRPNSITDYTGTTITTDFSIYGGVYCVTKKPGDATALSGTQITFSGNTSGNPYYIRLRGALVADKVAFQGRCAIEYTATSRNDPIIGTGVSGGYSDFQ